MSCVKSETEMWRRSPGDARAARSTDQRKIDDLQVRRRSLAHYFNLMGRQFDVFPAASRRLTRLRSNSSYAGESAIDGAEPAPFFLRPGTPPPRVRAVAFLLR